FRDLGFMTVSSKSKRRPSLVLLVLFALLTGVLAGTTAPSKTQAATRTGNEFFYYNNAAHQTLVGYQRWCSNGSHSGWGQITPYSVIQPAVCLEGACRGWRSLRRG